MDPSPVRSGELTLTRQDTRIDQTPALFLGSHPSNARQRVPHRLLEGHGLDRARTLAIRFWTAIHAAILRP